MCFNIKNLIKTKGKKQEKSNNFQTKPNFLRYTPKQYEEVKEISLQLISGNVVLIDMSQTEKLQTIRFVDFISGVLLSLDGDFEKIAPKIYLLAPSSKLLKTFLDKISDEGIDN